MFKIGNFIDRFWFQFTILIVISLLGFINGPPSNFSIANGDLVVDASGESILGRTFSNWRNVDSGYFDQSYPTDYLNKILAYLASFLGQNFPAITFSFFLGGSYLSFFCGSKLSICRMKDEEDCSRFEKRVTLFSLLYTFNLFTFTAGYSLWGYSLFLAPYAFFPLLYGTFVYVLMDSKRQSFSLFLWSLVGFLFSHSLSNFGFFVATFTVLSVSAAVFLLYLRLSVVWVFVVFSSFLLVTAWSWLPTLVSFGFGVSGASFEPENNLSSSFVSQSEWVLGQATPFLNPLLFSFHLEHLFEKFPLIVASAALLYVVAILSFRTAFRWEISRASLRPVQRKFQLGFLHSRLSALVNSFVFFVRNKGRCERIIKAIQKIFNQVLSRTNKAKRRNIKNCYIIAVISSILVLLLLSNKASIFLSDNYVVTVFTKSFLLPLRSTHKTMIFIPFLVLIGILFLKDLPKRVLYISLLLAVFHFLPGHLTTHWHFTYEAGKNYKTDKTEKPIHNTDGILSNFREMVVDDVEATFIALPISFADPKYGIRELSYAGYKGTAHPLAVRLENKFLKIKNELEATKFLHLLMNAAEEPAAKEVLANYMFLRRVNFVVIDTSQPFSDWAPFAYHLEKLTDQGFFKSTGRSKSELSYKMDPATPPKNNWVSRINYFGDEHLLPNLADFQDLIVDVVSNPLILGGVERLEVPCSNQRFILVNHTNFSPLWFLIESDGLKPAGGCTMRDSEKIMEFQRFKIQSASALTIKGLELTDSLYRINGWVFQAEDHTVSQKKMVVWKIYLPEFIRYIFLIFSLTFITYLGIVGTLGRRFGAKI